MFQKRRSSLSKRGFLLIKDEKEIQKRIDEIDERLSKITDEILEGLDIAGIEFLDLKYIAEEVNILKNKKRELENQLRFE